MKNIFLISFGILCLLCNPLLSQNRISKNMPDGGTKTYIATEVVEFKPGYYYSGLQNQSMTAFIGRTASIQWRMEDRYGVDKNDDGFIDLPNSTSYANPDYLKVTCSLDFKVPLPQDFGSDPCVDCKFPTDCIWYVNGLTNFPVENPQEKYNPTFKFQDEETYAVRAELIFEHKGKKIVYYTPVTEITPNDILIVALGDSYASGEGNPDRELTNGLIWADDFWKNPNPDGLTGVTSNHNYTPNVISEDHKIAHRSTFNWSSLAAIQIERLDPHTSVTYINLGSGGSETEDIIYRESGMHEKENNKRHPYLQLPEAKRLVSGRKVEALAIIIGGNNLGFKSCLTSYLLSDAKVTIVNALVAAGVTGNALAGLAAGLLDNPKKDKEAIANSILHGNWDPKLLQYAIPLKLNDLLGDNVDWEHVSGFKNLSNNYDLLNDAIKQSLKTDRVYFMQYPDIANGCTSVLPHMGLLKIDAGEIEHAKNNLLTPLNELIAQKCIQHNWVLLQPGDWTNHGSCKDKPLSYGFNKKGEFPKPTNDNLRWTLDLDDSKSVQDDKNGAGHPNVYGHLAMSESFLSAMAPGGFVTSQVSLNRMHGDFNGDRKPDMLYLGQNIAAVSVSGNFRLSNTGSWLDLNIGLEGFWTVGDFNGDGKDDILATYSGIGVKVYCSDGTSFQYAGVWTTAGLGSEGFWTIGDFNGDGKDDILRTITTSGEVQVFSSNGYSFTGPVKWTGSGYGVSGFWTVGDFNGDGKDDILRNYQGVEVLESTGSSFKSPSLWCNIFMDSEFELRNKTWIVGDFNGDKKADILQFTSNYILNTNNIEVAISSGSGFSFPTKWYFNSIPLNNNNNPMGKIGFFARDYSFLHGDFTNDGKTDILFQGPFHKDILLSPSGANFIEDTRWKE